MIKRSTVFKIMFAKNWKPAATAVATLAVIVAISLGIGRYFDVDPSAVYWTLILVLLLVTGLKWSYDWNKSAIEMEQKQMLRDIEKKHL